MVDESAWPLPFEGLLLKMSPAPLRFGSFQERFVGVNKGKLYWWSTQEEAETCGFEGAKGVLDFALNPCKIESEPSGTSKFYIQPVDGRWSSGKFTGVEHGRVFYFDAADSEHARDVWVGAIREHIVRAQNSSDCLRGRALNSSISSMKIYVRGFSDQEATEFKIDGAATLEQLQSQISASFGHDSEKTTISLLCGHSILRGVQLPLVELGIEDGTLLTCILQRRRKEVITCDGSSAKVWDARTGECKLTFQGHDDSVRTATFSPDVSSVLTASHGTTAKIWDADTGECKRTFEGHDGCVFSAVFSADGSSVLTASSDTTAKLWDADTGECKLTFEGHDDRITSAIFSPDGSCVLTASWDFTAKIWDAHTGECKVTLEIGHTFKNHLLAAFSRDGSFVVTCCEIPMIWDADTGECKLEFEGHRDAITSAEFTADGSSVLTASLDGAAMIWDVDTGQCKVAFEGHDDRITSAAFSADGSSVVTTSMSYDGTAKIWDAHTGVCKLTVGGDVEDLLVAAFSADGSSLMTADGERVNIWDANTGECKLTIECTDVFNEDGHGHRGRVVSAVYLAD